MQPQKYSKKSYFKNILTLNLSWLYNTDSSHTEILIKMGFQSWETKHQRKT